jgi:hypothetical protein
VRGAAPNRPLPSQKKKNGCCCLAAAAGPRTASHLRAIVCVVPTASKRAPTTVGSEAESVTQLLTHVREAPPSSARRCHGRAGCWPPQRSRVPLQQGAKHAPRRHRLLPRPPPPQTPLRCRAPRRQAAGAHLAAAGDVRFVEVGGELCKVPRARS